MWARLRKHLLPLTVILLFVLFVTRVIWSTRSVIETHDGIFHVIRQAELTEMIRLGQFPVRWAGRLDNGFGLPLFNYVYPGPYYLALPLTLIGISAKWAIKLLMLGSYLMGGVGVYFLFATRSRRRALFAALLYLSTPYLLLNLFVRGALGELLAMSLLPLVILFLQDLSNTKKLKWYHPLPYFLLFLSHNFLSFLFLPIYLLYAFFRRSFKSALISLILSLGLAAFFVIPMLSERGYLLSVTQNDYTYTYQDHFVYLSQLLYSPWGHGYSVVGSGDAMSFQLGIPQLFFVATALWLLLKKRGNPDLKFWLAILAAVIFFTTPLSLPLWRFLSPLQIVQFPWRMLALSSMPLAIIAYYSLQSGKLGSSKRLLLLILLGIGFIFAYLYSTPAYLQNPAQFQQQLYIHQEKTTTSSRRELLPKWSTGDERWKGDEEARVLRGVGDLLLTSANPISLTIRSITDDPNAVYLIRRHYFPLWQLTDESGKIIPLSPDEAGEIIFAPDIGSHEYSLTLLSTPIERLSNFLTILTFLTIITLAYVQKRSR